MYPDIRLRRNRKTPWLRDLVAENCLLPSNLILSIFIIEGEKTREAITTMPGVFRLTIDYLVQEAKLASSLGIRAIALFPCIDISLKNDNADEAYNLDNLVCRAIRTIKNAKIDIGLICDLALDPYTLHGHDGIVNDGEVDNDATIEALCNQALILAKAGADIVAPSDMMDGRINAIRQELDQENFINVNILAYAAKYASNFYTPFRDAVGSNHAIKKLDKSSYQMDIRNINEAMREIEQDLFEGADIIMIKPGMMCLDVIQKASQTFNIPIFAYQVSGEYAMLKLAAQAGALNWEACLLESLICFKRAGANSIITYAAIEAAKLIKKIND